jgi:Cytidylate kinase
MENYVLTITRDFGSLGRPIAKRLSEILKIEYYDRDIVEAAAKRMHLPVSLISNEEEKGTGFFRMLFPLGMESPEWQEKIFRTQQSIICDLAAKDPCIIVGRCSDSILADEKNAIHIYIYASYQDRYNNCIQSLGMQPEEAKRMIAQVDKARRSYHNQYAKYAYNDQNHKDLMVNSSLLGVEGTAQLLAGVVQLRFGAKES